MTVPAAAAAIQQAFANRQDLKAAQAQVQAAERVVSAAHAERLPSVSLNGDYGVLGPNPASAHGVFSVSGSVNVPIWLGGRMKADIEQAQTELAQRKAELADQRGQVEQEVRTALIEVETAIGQVELAQQNREYAGETLRESRDRFQLGVATTVEVVQAQEQVASAESDYVSSLYSFEMARLALARAIGEAEKEIPGLLKASRHEDRRNWQQIHARRPRPPIRLWNPSPCRRKSEDGGARLPSSFWCCWRRLRVGFISGCSRASSNLPTMRKSRCT